MADIAVCWRGCSHSRAQPVSEAHPGPAPSLRRSLGALVVLDDALEARTRAMRAACSRLMELCLAIGAYSSRPPVRTCRTWLAAMGCTNMAEGILTDSPVLLGRLLCGDTRHSWAERRAKACAYALQATVSETDCPLCSGVRMCQKAHSAPACTALTSPA